MQESNFWNCFGGSYVGVGEKRILFIDWSKISEKLVHYKKGDKSTLGILPARKECQLIMPVCL